MLQPPKARRTFLLTKKWMFMHEVASNPPASPPLLPLPLPSSLTINMNKITLSMITYAQEPLYFSVNRRAALQSTREFNIFSTAGVSTQALINSNFGNPFPLFHWGCPIPSWDSWPKAVIKPKHRAKPLCLQTTPPKRAHSTTNLSPNHPIQE